MPADGVPRRMAGYAGESLLEVMMRHKMPGIWPDCAGGDQENQMRAHQDPVDYYSAGVHCAQCSVHIPHPWHDKLNRKPDTEVRRISNRDEANSSFVRLACCVNIQPEINEMVVVIGQNRSSNGEWFGGDDPDAF